MIHRTSRAIKSFDGGHFEPVRNLFTQDLMRKRRLKIETIFILRSTSYLEIHQTPFKIQDLVLQIASYLNFQSIRDKFAVSLINVVFILMGWLRAVLEQNI